MSVLNIKLCDLCGNEIRNINPIVYDNFKKDEEYLVLCQNCFDELCLHFNDPMDDKVVKHIFKTLNKIKKSYQGRCDSCYWFDDDVSYEKPKFFCWHKLNMHKNPKNIDEGEVTIDTTHQKKKCYQSVEEHCEERLAYLLKEFSR